MGDDLQTSETTCINPATGEEIGRKKILSTQELQSVFENARIAQPGWADLDTKERAKYLLRVRDYIVERPDSIAGIISADNGKLKMDALTAEIIPITMAITHYVKTAPKFLKNEQLKPANILLANKRSFIRKIPYGVVGIISPWNYPFSIPMFEVIQALLAGNCVILKAATETQMIAQVIENAFQSAGLPEGIFTCVNVPGKIAGKAFLEFGVNKLFFTGSVAVGKKLWEMAAKTLTPVNLELGGNDAMIVCEDANIDRAVGGAIWGGFQNSGQSCGGVERIYVHQKVYNLFMEKLKARVELMRAGNGSEYTNDLGCITTRGQMEVIQSHISEALAHGAEIFAESKVCPNMPENFLPATVLVNVNHTMRIMKEETFGPVVGVMKVNSDEEAIRYANDSDLGLTASVWTKSNKHGIRISEKIQTGVVNINDHLMSHGLAETPWGGFKESGFGRSHGEPGFGEMVQTQVIVRDVLPFVNKDLWWHPYNFRLYQGMTGIIKVLYSKKLSERFTGAKNLIKILPRIFNVNRE